MPRSFVSLFRRDEIAYLRGDIAVAALRAALDGMVNPGPTTLATPKTPSVPTVHFLLQSRVAKTGRLAELFLVAPRQ